MWYSFTRNLLKGKYLCDKHHAMKICGGQELDLHTFLTLKYYVICAGNSKFLNKPKSININFVPFNFWENDYILPNKTAVVSCCVGPLSSRHGASLCCRWRDGLQLWRVAAVTLNKQPWTTATRGVGFRANNPSL
jgi:hypothetical protein